MSVKEIPVRILDHGIGLELPHHATDQSAGVDLRAAVDEGADITLKPGERQLIPTGLTLALPEGLKRKFDHDPDSPISTGVTVLNSPGTIDSDYRGEVKVLLINHGQDAFTIERGMRIAQMIVASYQKIQFQEDASQTESSSTLRAAAGFGSTGVR